MKNTTPLAIIGVIIVLVGAFVFLNSGRASSGAVEQIVNEESQKITLGMKNFNYYPDTITLKAGQPVEITLDASVKGCLRSFAIPEFNVQQFSKSPEQKVTFTPTRKGTFAFMCSMGMGRGKAIVQ